MSFFRVCTRFKHPKLRLSWPSSATSAVWQAKGERQGCGCTGYCSPQEYGQQFCMQQLLYCDCCWYKWVGVGGLLSQSTIIQWLGFSMGLLVNSLSILKACSMRMFQTSLERQFIQYFWVWDYSQAGYCGQGASLNFSCLSSALSQRSQRDLLTIFYDFQEQFERLLREIGKCSSWLVSDLSLTDKLLGSREEKVWTVDTCWLKPLMFFLCQLLVPQSESSSRFLRSAVSMASRMLFSISTPMKYSDRQIFLSSLSRAFSLPFSSYLFHCAWKSSQRVLSSLPQTMIFSPAQQQKSQQMLLICLKKLISFDRWMLRHRFSAPSSTKQPQISWMGNSFDSDLSQKLSSLSVLPCVLMSLSGSLLQVSSLSTSSVVASWLSRSLMMAGKWIWKTLRSLASFCLKQASTVSYLTVMVRIFFPLYTNFFSYVISILRLFMTIIIIRVRMHIKA